MRPTIQRGRALTNGIELGSDNFVVRARRKNNIIELDFDELEDDVENSAISKITDIIDEIPIIRGISNYMSSSLFNKLFIIAIIISDFFRLFAQKNNSGTYNIANVYTTITIIFLVILLYLLVNIKSISQYHGVEHKVVNTYEKHKKLNLQNVKNASRIHKDCGTIYVIFLLFVFIILSFVINIFSIKLLLSFGIAYEISRSNKFQYVDRLGGWLQDHLTTLEPNQKQIEVGIACIDKLLELEKNKK